MPKPVLSDSLFNADNVATAVLAEANLSVTNQDFGVTEITDLLTPVSTINVDLEKAYSFNGFIFLYVVGNGTQPSTAGKIFDINPSYTPNDNYSFPTISYQSDSAQHIQFKTDDTVVVHHSNNLGTSNWYFAINGWYRYT